MQRQWFTSHQLRPGDTVFDWQRPFTLWGYTGSHSMVLFRSVKAAPDEDAGSGEDGAPDQDGPATRIDLVFKPVEALGVRSHYRTLAVRVATRERADQVLGRLPNVRRDERVLELVGPDGAGDHVVCMAVGCHEDEGEWWEPSPFATDLADGRTPPWRSRVLGGAPDGELTARFASLEELTAAVHAGAPRPFGGRKGRYLFVTMMQTTGPDDAAARAVPLAAFLTRDEAEEHVRASGGAHQVDRDHRFERWIETVPLDL